jgi:hypothetical protein
MQIPARVRDCRAFLANAIYLSGPLAQAAVAWSDDVESDDTKGTHGPQLFSSISYFIDDAVRNTLLP